MKEFLEREISEYEIIHSTAEINQQWAEIMTSLPRRGFQISPQNAWIAATAV